MVFIKCGGCVLEKGETWSSQCDWMTQHIREISACWIWDCNEGALIFPWCFWRMLQSHTSSVSSSLRAESWLVQQHRVVRWCSSFRMAHPCTTGPGGMSFLCRFCSRATTLQQDGSRVESRPGTHEPGLCAPFSGSQFSDESSFMLHTYDRCERLETHWRTLDCMHPLLSHDLFGGLAMKVSLE